MLLLVSLLASTAFCRSSAADSDAEDDDDYAEADHAHLIVRKYFKDEFGVQGRNLTVYVDVYNAGTSGAKSVQLKDAKLPAGLSLVDGSLTKAIGSLDVGERASHSYVISASKGSKGYLLDAAKVSYLAEIDSKDPQVGTSTRAGIYVLTPVEQIQRYALNGGRYLTLGILNSPKDWRNFGIIIAVLAALIGGNQAVKSGLKARSTSKRNKALASLEKNE